ncbi:MAG: hypothetical protein K0S01_1670 [Herbinix sp.]|jgi:hypothetical protein|nr:hypothetical protein [Herbinix sp.]
MICYKQIFQLFPLLLLWGKGGTMLILPNNALVAKKGYIISALLGLKHLI